MIETLDDIYLQPEAQPAKPDAPVADLASASDAAGVRSVLRAVGKRTSDKLKKGG